MKRPELNTLSYEPVTQIIAEGMELLMDPGVRAPSDGALRLLVCRKAR
jgi:hypothetical protein